MTYQLVAWVILAFFFAIISASDLIIAGVAGKGGSFILIPGPAYFFFIVYVLGFFAYAFFRLIERYYLYRGLNRRQIVYVILGFLFGFVPPVVTNLILPLFGYSALIEIGPLATLITVIFISYAITKAHLMDISIVISRTVAVIITSFIYLSIFFFAHYWQLPFYYHVLVDAFLLLASGLTFQAVRLHIQTAADRTFIKGWYDYLHVQRKIATGLARSLARADIVKVIAPILMEEIDLVAVQLFFQDMDVYLEYDAVSGELKPGSFLAKSDPAVTKIIDKHDIFSDQGKLYIPSFVKDELLAFLVLGGKRSEDSFTNNDFEVFKTIGEYLAICLEYIVRPYEEVRKNFEANEKKLYETERLLARSEKIASLANLIREYNHEIKTPLTIIRSELALWPDDPKTAESKQVMIDAIKRANDIVESTLRLSQPKEHHEEAVNIAEVVESALKLFPPSGVHVALDLRPVPMIKGDKEDLQTVFVNLIKNAVEAMPDGGELRLKTYTEQADAKQLVCAEVTDTGVGIPEENKEKIFEPFFSTHVTKGRGLGLSIIFRIIREHGGTISINSKVGEGTTFKLSF